MDWAVEAAKARRVVISGFHSPLERSVFEVLLTANAVAVMALTRDPGHSPLPKLWDEAAQRGTLLILGPAGAKGRLTDELARERNNWVASMAAHIVVAHAAPVGGLAAQVAGWREDKRSVEVLSP